jgi:hypothetical protein
MSDPRDQNCRRFAETEGMVTGVELVHAPRPGTKYELVKATLIDERAAQGNTVASIFVKDRDGYDVVSANCWLAWPWKGDVAQFEGRGRPGNPNYPIQHMITNAFNPSQQGPLAIYIGDGAGNIDSDVIGGLGLPGGHHVCFQLIYRERTADGDDGGGVSSGSDAVQLQRIEDKLDRIARHFGIQF